MTGGWIELASIVGGLLLIFVRAYFSNDVQKKTEALEAAKAETAARQAADQLLKAQLEQAAAKSQGVRTGFDEADKDIQG